MAAMTYPYRLAMDTGAMYQRSVIFLVLAVILLILAFDMIRRKKRHLFWLCAGLCLVFTVFWASYHLGYHVSLPPESTYVSVHVPDQEARDSSNPNAMKELSQDEKEDFFNALHACTMRSSGSNPAAYYYMDEPKHGSRDVIQIVFDTTVVCLVMDQGAGCYLESNDFLWHGEVWIQKAEPIQTWWDEYLKK
ncbi:MAG: hypothetical protein IJ744_09910 [Lachnospiraceae bacterium]|nr:hypothetical protein [Lachnospiraceae bacterium]